jgi:hypothetical protein
MPNGFGSVTYFDNRLLFQVGADRVGADRMIVTDLNGTYVREFSPWSTLHLLNAVTAFINSGPDAPAFGAYSAGEFVLWQLEGKQKKK